MSEMGDYVKMDYLQSCMKKNFEINTRKFVIVKLAGIYEVRKMYLDAGKLLRISAEISTSFQGKITDFVRSGELFIKAGNFAEADFSFDKAYALADSSEKNQIKENEKEFYKTQAVVYLTKGQRKHAMDTYEKLLKLDLSFEDKKKVQESLLELYNRLGKVREYFNLKRGFDKKVVEEKEIKKDNLDLDLIS